MKFTLTIESESAVMLDEILTAIAPKYKSELEQAARVKASHEVQHLKNVAEYEALKAQKEKIKDMSIDELCLPVRAHNVLKNQRIHTIGTLTKWNALSLRKLPNCGALTLAHIIEAISEMGLSLATGSEQSTAWDETP